jgi:hypothetical protein
LISYQLRRYELDPDLADAFLAWVDNDVMPIRKQFGFKAEWMYLAADKSELTWLASYPGSEDDFLQAEAAYTASPERSQAASTMPPALVKAHVGFVSKTL